MEPGKYFAKYNGNGLPFYLFEDAFYLVKFESISNKIIQISPVRIEKVTEKLDERVEFDIDSCSLFSSQQNDYIQNSINWNSQLLDCMEKVEDKDGIVYVGISLEIEGVDAAILCPPENISKEWEYEDWLDTDAREKNGCKISQKTKIEDIKRNEIYASGIAFHIATCDLRCLDRYENNRGANDMVYSTLQETERKYLGFAQPEEVILSYICRS